MKEGVSHCIVDDRLLQEGGFVLVVHSVGEVDLSRKQLPPLRQPPFTPHFQNHPQNWSHLPLVTILSTPNHQRSVRTTVRELLSFSSCPSSEQVVSQALSYHPDRTVSSH